jgi:RNA polymerase sigma-70 factor, ECF subfamily
MDLESRVVALLQRDDATAAASAAIEGFGPSVYGYLCALLEEDDARDVFSQWAEDLWRGLAGFRRECTLRAWAYKLAWHAAARHRRDPYRARRERLPTGAASRLAASTVASSALHGGRRALLRRLRASLGPEDETLLVLRIDKELEWEEIAAVLSTGAATADGGPAAPGPGEAPPAPVSPAALRKRFERLKDRLAERAREEGLLE